MSKPTYSAACYLLMEIFQFIVLPRFKENNVFSVCLTFYYFSVATPWFQSDTVDTVPAQMGFRLPCVILYMTGQCAMCFQEEEEEQLEEDGSVKEETAEQEIPN